ncbi:MAG: high-potential iron-sulfur protein [Chitinophagaceae bacterium]|nr:high-potential iron-sulfur protein [Rubrivivax sp.]
MTRINRPRRVLVTGIAFAGAAVLASRVFAQALVSEADPQAKGLGYASDASKVDAKKFPKYVAGQNCANCALYQAKATDPVGPCPLFAGRQVPAKAWCSAWARKA